MSIIGCSLSANAVAEGVEAQDHISVTKTPDVLQRSTWTTANG